MKYSGISTFLCIFVALISAVRHLKTTPSVFLRLAPFLRFYLNFLNLLFLSVSSRVLAAKIIFLVSGFRRHPCGAWGSIPLVGFVWCLFQERRAYSLALATNGSIDSNSRSSERLALYKSQRN